MRRGSARTLLLALLCLVSGGCATLTGTGSGEPAGPSPGSAIALSVLSDSVYLVDPATGRTSEVVGGLLDFQSGYATWAPDHRRLAYGNHGIYSVDFVRSEQRLMIRGPRLSMPSWSAAGDRILYGDGVSMWLARTGVAGAAPVRLPTPATLAALDMDWGRNGLIAFEGLVRDCRRPPRCQSTGRSEIWVLDPNGKLLRQVTRVGHAESPKWSPDGTRILFIRRSRTIAAGSRELWVVNADGSGARRLGGAQNVVAAAWSPDGFRMATVNATKPNTLQLWITDLDGSNARAVGGPAEGTEATLDW